MGSDQQYSLRWNNYLNHITDAFESLRTGEDFVDVTLSCEGKKIRAHKMLLSACSSYFRDLFKENPCQHPIIIFRNVKYEDLIGIVDFMYQGEVNVVQEQLPTFLATAELLAIKGLTPAWTREEVVAAKDIEETFSSPIPVEVEDEPQSVVTKSVVSSTQSFLNTKKRPPSPQHRKRKHGLQSVPTPLPDNFREKKSCVIPSSNNVQEENDDDEPVEVIPLMSNVKIENEEMLDDSYEDIIEEEVKPLQTVLRNSDLSVTHSATEYSFIKKSSSLHDITSGEVVDMEPVFMEPGTSSDVLPQDSMQVEKPDGTSELNFDQYEGIQAVDSSSEITAVEEIQEEEVTYACETCHKEKKSNDSTSHKCPICTEEFFCTHLLKEHMKVIHGWFSVERRYQSHL